mgnify:CR=1 FL=1
MFTVKHVSKPEMRLVKGSLYMLGFVKVVSCHHGCLICVCMG